MKKRKSRSTLHQAPKEMPPDKALVRKFLTVPELNRLIGIAEPSPRNLALVMVTYECALRASEPGMLILAYAKDLHRTERIYVHRGKGSRSGHVYLSTKAQKALIRWIGMAYPGKRDPESYIFPGGRWEINGKGITREGVYKIYNSLAEQARVPKHLRHPHVLKASRAQHMIEAMVKRGKDPWNALQAIAELIGHASAMTTIKHYLSQSSDERKMARDITEGLYYR